MPDVFQTLNNIKATGVLRLKSNAGSRDVVFQQGEIIGVGFLDKEGREDLEMRLSLLGIDEKPGERLKGVTWYWTAMTARSQASRTEVDEIIHEQAREQLHNLFAWATADFAFDEAGPGKAIANELVGRSLERPLSIDTATILLEAAKQQDEWAELRARIRDEAGAAAMGSSPDLSALASRVTADAFDPPAEPEESTFHLYLDGEWRGPYPRPQIVGMVQTGEVAPETWSYDPRTQERKTLDQLLGNEARRITPDELESMRQAVKAAENRLAEELAGRAADLAELRGLASEILRLANDCSLSDPAIAAVVERLGEVVNGDDPSIVALAAETVVVAVVRHLRDLGERELEASRARADELSKRITAAEQERGVLEQHLAEAERRSDAEREAASVLRERLAAAAEDASHLNQELERARRDHQHQSTARISNPRDPQAIANARNEAEGRQSERAADLERELGRMRADHARLLSEVANLQARLDENRARHEAELEASRALASSLAQRQDPPTERHDRDTERHDDESETERHAGTASHGEESSLALEVERLRGLLAAAEQRAGGGDILHALEERDRVAAERDAARGDTERLRRDLGQARAEAARAAELARAAEQAETRIAAAEGRVSAAEARVSAAEARASEAEMRFAESERRARQTGDELAAVRAALESAESLHRERERGAQEAAQQNIRLESRLRELAQRLADGEARLAELDHIADELATTRTRATELEGEAQRIRAELQAVRETASGKLDRAKRRVGELRTRLREAKHSRAWTLPTTGPFPQAPMPQAAAPVMQPVAPTMQPVAPTQPQAPSTSPWQQQQAQPSTSPWQQPVPPSFAPGHPGWQQPPWPVGQPYGQQGFPEQSQPSVRTTSGTFVPMPMPAQDAPVRAQQQLAVIAQPSEESPRARLLRGPWPIAAAAGLALALGLGWRATTAVPVCERARVNGESISISAPIQGRVESVLVKAGTWVERGTRLAVVRNPDRDTMRKQVLEERKSAQDARVRSFEATLKRIQGEHDRLVAELAQPLPAGTTRPLDDPRLRLRDEYATRLLDTNTSLDDARARLEELRADLATETQRLDREREQPIEAPVSGLVTFIQEGAAVMQGQAVSTMIDASTLLIDAEAPFGAGVGPGMQAEVHIGGLKLPAQVLSSDEVRLGHLAREPSLTAGYTRVLLKPANQSALRDAYIHQGRIAFHGGDPGIFGSFGLWMRGF